jgi:hypothetical protein
MVVHNEIFVSVPMLNEELSETGGIQYAWVTVVRTLTLLNKNSIKTKA